MLTKPACDPHVFIVSHDKLPAATLTTTATVMTGTCQLTLRYPSNGNTKITPGCFSLEASAERCRAACYCSAFKVRLAWLLSNSIQSSFVALSSFCCVRISHVGMSKQLMGITLAGHSLGRIHTFKGHTQLESARRALIGLEILQAFVAKCIQHNVSIE